VLRKKWFLVLCCVFAAVSAGGLDFGVTIDQELETSNDYAGDTGFSYTPTLRPWVSGVFGKDFSFYVSGAVSADFEKDAWRTNPVVLPELTRTGLSWLVSPAFSLTLGRQHFADPSGFAASGLFDGLRASFSLGQNRFSAGAYYTGLLYKDAADIIMTGRDAVEHAKPPDEIYFASRRVLLSAQWENPGLGPASSLALGFLGQTDVNSKDEDLHSQYLSARYGLKLPRGFGLEALAALGRGERNGEAVFFFAGGGGLTWSPPSAWDDGISLRGLYSSPKVNDRVVAFIPVNSLPRGQVFGPALGGLSVVRAGYTLRPLRGLSLGAEGSYFIRVDTESFQDTRDELKEDGYFLGAEVFGTALWTPLPDLALSVGGGAFFPGLGNAFSPDADVRWKAVIKFIVSL
jgi:hypothetical protein